MTDENRISTEKAVFQEAILIADVRRRDDYLTAACRDNVALRRRIDALLESDEGGGSFMRKRAVHSVAAAPSALRRYATEMGPILCPSCQSSIELPENPSPEKLLCPSCGLSIELDSYSTAEWSPGEIQRRLGRYELVDLVGSGSFGTVYKARDPELDRIVAIKIPRAGQVASEGDIERFLREARSVAKLRHPSIVSIYEVGEAAGLPYLVSEFVEGITLAGWLSARRPSPRESAKLIASVADALQYAHEMGVVHRDIKPANIMLDEGGNPKLMDFGLARREAADVTMTVDGQILGTPAYMSPEQAKGEAHEVDGRTDVYSLGVILYQLLTGELPFRGTTRMLLHQVLHDEPRRPRSLADHVPRDLETICLRAMDKEPSGRYATARDMADDLRRFQKGEPIHARPIGRAERLWRWCRRKPALAITTAAAAILLLVVALGGTFAALEFRQQAEEAEEDFYFNSIALAHREIVAGNLGEGQTLLRECPKRLRDWEWSYLAHLCEAEPIRLPGHPGSTQTVAFSPDGRRLAIPSEDLSIKIWDTTTLREVAAATIANAGEITCVAFHPSDGQRLVTGDKSGAVSIWDVTTSKRVWTRRGHASVVRHVAFSPDGRLLASASEDKKLKLWNATTGKLNHDLTEHTGWVVTVAFSPDGRRLASGSFDTTVRLWDTQTGKRIDTLRGHENPVSGVVFSPDGQRLASGSMDRTVKIWDLPRQEHVTLVGHLLRVSGVAFLDSGRRVASASDDKTVKIWNIESGQAILTLRGHTHDLNGLACSPDGLRLASTSGDRTTRIWDASAVVPKPKREVFTLQGHTDQVWGLAYSSDGQRLVTHGWDRTARIWDTATGQPDFALEHFIGVVFGAAFSPDGRHIATGSVKHADHEPSPLKVWDAMTGQEVLPLISQRNTFAVAYSPDGQWLAAGENRGNTTVWEATTGTWLRTLPSKGERIHSVAFSPNGRRLACLSNDGLVDVYDTTRWDEEPLHFRAHTVSVRGNLVFDPDGMRLVIPGDDNTVNIWDTTTIGEQEVSTPQMTLRGHTAQVWGVAFSHDGRWVASGGEDNTVRLWNAETGEEDETIHGHSLVVSRVAFSPDRKHLASASFDGTVKIWDLSTITQK